ncbi:uncharacterized protein LOC142576516 [Dermacentor variabilis]|uniref:uncharacterized protein LOC142576516 n=1 Tax=Dermacentor variabilis TaxID=34621 RepID=UPI003F5B35C3
MGSLNYILAFVLAVVALPKLKAWVTDEWYCQRLAPLSITSVVTPCTFPCLLISPYNAHARIFVRKEADGTPCKISGRASPPFQESSCCNGLCQFPAARLQLQRMKRETRLIRERRGLLKKIKETLTGKKKEKKEKKKKEKKEKKKKEKS